MTAKPPFTFQHTHPDLYRSWYVSDITYEGERLQIGMPAHYDCIVARHWVGVADHELNRDRLPWHQYNVGRGLLEEGVVYLGLSWRLVHEQQLDCYAIPRYYRDEAATLLKKPFDFVAWEYRVIAEDPHHI